MMACDDMDAASQPVAERARKMQAMILQRLAARTASAVATTLGVSESTISRERDHFDLVRRIAAQLGIKFVDESRECTRPDELRFLRWAYAETAAKAPWILGAQEQDE